MGPFRFLQVSDLRFGAVPPLPELQIDARVRRLLVEDQRRVLERVVELAVEQGVDLVLVAGDLIDDAHATPEDADLVVRAIASIGVPVLLAPGDRDPPHPASYLSPEVLELMGKSPLPANLTVFRAMTPTTVTVAGAAVTGWATSPAKTAGEDAARVAGPRSALAALPKVAPGSARCHIVLAHQGGPVMPVLPAAELVASAGITYIALGHDEAPLKLTDGQGQVRVGRAGHPVPNRMSAAQGGLYLGTIDPRGGVVVDLVDTGARLTHAIDCDVSGVEPAELVAHLKDLLPRKGVRAQDLVLVKLAGTWRGARLPSIGKRALEPACTHVRVDAGGLVLALQNAPTVRDLHRAGLIPQPGQAATPAQMEALRLIDAAWEGGEVIPSGENPSDPL